MEHIESKTGREYEEHDEYANSLNTDGEESNSENFNLSNINVVVEQIASDMGSAEQVKSLAELAIDSLAQQPQTEFDSNIEEYCGNDENFSLDYGYEVEGWGDVLYPSIDAQHYDGTYSVENACNQNFDIQMAHPMYTYPPYQLVPPTYSTLPSQTTEEEWYQSSFQEISLTDGSLVHGEGSDGGEQYQSCAYQSQECTNPIQNSYPITDISSGPVFYQCIGQDGIPSTIFNVNAPSFYPSGYTLCSDPNSYNDNEDSTIKESNRASVENSHLSEITNDAKHFTQNKKTTETSNSVNDHIDQAQSHHYESWSETVKFGAVDPTINLTGSAMFQYPSIYVSDSGLITVLLKNDVSMEMTVDLAIRLVCHQNQLVVATSNTGSATFMSHPAAKIAQNPASIEAEISLGRKAKLTPKNITFANRTHCYKFDNETIDRENEAELSLIKDNSVEYLFQSAELGAEVVPECISLISQAEYRLLNRGGFMIKVNRMKITQTNRGDVSVLCGPKYLRLSPGRNQLTVQTQDVDMSIDSNSVIEIQRGQQYLFADQLEMQLSNGHIEAGFDQDNQVYATTLPDMMPLPIGSRRKRARTPANRMRRRQRNLSYEY